MMDHLSKLFTKKYKSFVIGVDPASNLAKKVNMTKINTINDFFNFKLSNFIKKNIINSILFLQEMLLHI